MDYLILVIGALMCSVQFLFIKLYQKTAGESLKGSMIFSFFGSVFSAIIVLVCGKFSIEFSVFSLLLAFFVSVVGISVTAVGIKTMQMGKLSVYTLFMMLGGMILPFILGVTFLGERPSVCCIIACIIVAAALCIPALEKTDGKKSPPIFFVLCAGLFFLNGSYSCLNKLHQINKNAVDTFSFLFLVFMWMMLITGLVIIFSRFDKKTPPVKVTGKGVLAALGYAAFSSAGSICLVGSAKHVNASLLFPVVTGGTIVFSALCGWIFYKEKPNRYAVVEIVMAVAATILFMF
ncbi:MAG: DMT family transporter [Clostridiales bacterium]|nr:DMT family transporter [Clostridiales bacterium]